MHDINQEVRVASNDRVYVLIVLFDLVQLLQSQHSLKRPMKDAVWIHVARLVNPDAVFLRLNGVVLQPLQYFLLASGLLHLGALFRNVVSFARVPIGIRGIPLEIPVDAGG